MSQKLLSVIVPLFKVNAYLPDLIRSFEPLDVAGVEFIFVDDECPENGGDLVQDLTRHFTTEVHIVRHDENKGIIGARRTGLLRAQGRYSWFVDSDDILNVNVLADLLRFIADAHAREIDCILFNFDRVQCGNSGLEYSEAGDWNFPRDQIVVGTSEIVEHFFCNWRMYAWTYISRTEIWKTVRFPGRMVYEDIATTPAIILKSKTAILFDQVVVHYRMRGDSITGRATNRYPHINGMLSAMQHCNDEFESARPVLSQKAIDEYLAFYLITIGWAARMARISRQLTTNKNVQLDLKNSVQSYIAVAGQNNKSVYRAARAVIRGSESKKMGRRKKALIRSIKLLSRGFDPYFFVFRSNRRRDTLSWLVDFI